MVIHVEYILNNINNDKETQLRERERYPMVDYN